MQRGPLERLVDAARALPGEKRPMIAPVSVGSERRSGEVPTPAPLRAGVGRLLVELSRRVDPALTRALARAESHWDQFDEVAILDESLRGWAGALASPAST